MGKCVSCTAKYLFFSHYELFLWFFSLNIIFSPLWLLLLLYSPFLATVTATPLYFDCTGPLQVINLGAICVFSTTFCRLFILQDQQQKRPKGWKIVHFFMSHYNHPNLVPLYTATTPSRTKIELYRTLRYHNIFMQ